MKFKLILGLIFFVLLVYNCSNGTPTSPESLLEAFSNAVSSDDKAKAETFFTKEAWNAKNDPGEWFFKQAVRKKFNMKTTNSRIKGKKAVVTADILREGKVVDQVYLYAVKVNDQWKFDGISENRNQGEHFLNDRLPARFNLAQYPASRELQDLGTKLIDIANPLAGAKDDPGKQETLLQGVLIGDPGSIYPGLRLLLKVANLNLKVVSTHMVDSIRRGAVVINDETGKEKVFIYVAREADGWKLINCTVGWLSEESILR